MFISAIKLGMLTWETPGTDSLLELQVHVRNCRVQLHISAPGVAQMRLLFASLQEKAVVKGEIKTHLNVII